MATTDYSDLLPYLISDLPACPTVLITQTIQNIAIDFCKETQVYTVELKGIDVVVGQTDYPIRHNIDCTVVERLFLAETQDDLTSANERIRRKELFPNQDYTMADKTTFRFKREPTIALTQGLIFTVTLRPTRDATDIDARIFEDWYMTLVEGVKWKLMEEQNKTWTSQNRSDKALRKYRDGITKARIEFERGALNADIMVTEKEGFIV